MTSYHFRTTTTYKVVLPQPGNKADLLDLAQAFITYETAQDPTARTPYYEAVQTNLAEAERLRIAVAAAENRRKQASERYKRAEKDAKPLIHQIRDLLASLYVKTPEVAQEWGLIVRQTGRNAGAVLIPQGRQDRLAFLRAYIRKESGRPEAEQFTQPRLADVTAVCEELVSQRQARETARQERQSEQARLDETCGDLLEALRQAAGYLVLVKYQREPHRDMAKWGFQVVLRTPSPGDTTQPAPEEAGEAGEDGV